MNKLICIFAITFMFFAISAIAAPPEFDYTADTSGAPEDVVPFMGKIFEANWANGPTTWLAITMYKGNQIEIIRAPVDGAGYAKELVEFNLDDKKIYFMVESRKFYLTLAYHGATPVIQATMVLPNGRRQKTTMKPLPVKTSQK